MTDNTQQTDALRAALKALNLADPWVGVTGTAAIVHDAIKQLEVALAAMREGEGERS